MNKPTAKQYKTYRADWRLAVKRVVNCVRSNTISLNDWSRGVIRRARQQHSASVVRQNQA